MDYTDKPTKRDILDILTGAARTIRVSGHAQRTFETSSGACCIVGAIRACTRGEGYDRGYAHAWALEILGDVLVGRDLPRAVMYWNDQPGRTVTEVLDLLDEAHSLLEVS